MVLTQIRLQQLFFFTLRKCRTPFSHANSHCFCKHLGSGSCALIWFWTEKQLGWLNTLTNSERFIIRASCWQESYCAGYQWSDCVSNILVRSSPHPSLSHTPLLVRNQLLISFHLAQGIRWPGKVLLPNSLIYILNPEAQDCYSVRQDVFWVTQVKGKMASLLSIC